MAEPDSNALTRPSLGDLANLVRDRRRSIPSTESSRTGLSVREAARLAGMSAVTWTRIEAGEEVRSLSLSAAEPVLRWQPGAIRRYLDTGIAPAETTTEATPTAAERKTIYEFEFEELLAELRRRYLVALDTRTRNLGAAGPADETAASVESRGMLAGLPMPTNGAEDDVAEGGRP